LEKFLMKKTLIALAAVAAVASTSAFAQSTVTLSGTAGFEMGRSNAANNDFEVRNPDDGQNTLAFAGSEDLGGGLKAGFYAQARFGNNDGATIGGSGTDPLMQNIYTSLSGSFGSVQVGRFLVGTLSGYDTFAGYGASPREEYGYVGFVGDRNNNTIQYTSPKFGGASLTVATTMNNTNTDREYQYLAINYGAGPLSVRFISERNMVTANGSDMGLGVSYDMKVAKLLLAHSTQDKGNAKATSIGVHVPMGKATLKASFRDGNESTTVLARTNRVVAVGVNYDLSKRTGLYFDLGSAQDAGQTAMRMGVTHSF
jgi:predicted porin